MIGSGRHPITVAAVDLGAESGRVTTVAFNGERMDLRIVNRFGNRPRVREELLRWDFDSLWGSISAGLGDLAARQREIAAVGVDAWGVDYGLIGADAALVDDPVCYRDERNAAELERARALVGERRLYDATGIQIMSINAVFGLMADAAHRPDRLAAARTLLMMPDVFHHRLCGSLVSEYTAVSTSGAYDMAGNRWAVELLDELGVPTHMLPEVALPGTDVGGVIGELAVGALRGTRVILPPSHDTASAVVAVPFQDPGALFISSGTWSLVGIEVGKAIVNDASRRMNLTNEGGYGGTIRLLRNVMGLWILQECRRKWTSEGNAFGYPELAGMAAAEPGLLSLIDPDAPEFLPPGDMPSRIRQYCARTGSPVPQSIGAVARCVIDSLALGYRAVADDIAGLTGHRLPSISVVGGGAQHELLAQLTADATGLAVHCGPAEATALGNAAVQLVALGELDGAHQIRQVIAAGTHITSYRPRPDPRWDEAAARLAQLRVSPTGAAPDLAASGGGP